MLALKAFCEAGPSHIWFWILGTGDDTKTDKFSEKFQTAFDPPPLIFGKSCCKAEIRPPTLEHLRKFIRFGIVTRPLLIDVARRWSGDEMSFIGTLAPGGDKSRIA